MPSRLAASRKPCVLASLSQHSDSVGLHCGTSIGRSELDK